MVSAAVGLFAVALTRGAAPVRVTPPHAAARQSPPSADPPSMRSDGPPATRPSQPPPSRNVFAYADRVERGASPSRPEEPPAQPPAAAPVRLVGFVRHGVELKAALSILGEVVILSQGEESGGYAVLSIDEDGVRLRAPDGAEISLQSPPS